MEVSNAAKMNRQPIWTPEKWFVIRPSSFNKQRRLRTRHTFASSASGSPEELVFESILLALKEAPAVGKLDVNVRSL
jgi:hypothetical protein